MKRLLRKLKLIQNFSTEIPIEKSLFVAKLQGYVEQTDFGPFSNIFEAFSFSKKEFKGQVGYEGFKIRRRKRFFNMNAASAIAQGTYRQKGEMLIIEMEVNGFSRAMIPFYLFLCLAYVIGLSSILFSADNRVLAVATAPFLFVHAAFMFGFPYLMMRRSVARTMHELEREFYFLTKEKHMVEHDGYNG